MAILKKSILNFPKFDVLGLKHDVYFNKAKTLDEIKTIINRRYGGPSLPIENFTGGATDAEKALHIFLLLKSFKDDTEYVKLDLKIVLKRC